jgi:hypothetical protein
MNNNFDLKKFLAEGKLLKEDTQSSFKQLLDAIPNEKYFYIADEEANDFFNPENNDPDYNWVGFDDDWDGDLVDYFYDEIFDNELKGKPGVKGDYYQDFQDIDRRENPKYPEDEYSVGANEVLLVDKIREIITDYKKLNFSNQNNNNKISQIEALIKQEYPEIINDGEIEKGTEEWLFLLQLALKVYGLNIANEYDILKAVDGKGPYAKQIANLGYGYVSDLEQALENLGVEVY